MTQQKDNMAQQEDTIEIIYDSDDMYDNIPDLIPINEMPIINDEIINNIYDIQIRYNNNITHTINNYIEMYGYLLYNNIQGTDYSDIYEAMNNISHNPLYNNILQGTDYSDIYEAMNNISHTPMNTLTNIQYTSIMEYLEAFH